jgi:hypothetical protein
MPLSRRGAVEKHKIIKGGRSYLNMQSAHKESGISFKVTKVCIRYEF